MGTDRVIIKALAASLAAGALCFATTATDVAPTPEPPTIADPAPTGPATTTPFTAPRYFNPIPPRQDNPTNPPGTWEVYPSPTTKHLYCVDFIDANNGWAGGAGVALRYRNGTWTEVTGHSSQVFSDMDILSLTDGWAVGWDGEKELPAIWRWDGSDWKEFQNPTGGLACIDMIDASHGWIGGNGYFLRFNGTNWEYGGSAPNNVQGIEMKSDTDGRAVGYKFIMRRAGTVWTQEVNNNNWHLGGVRMLSGSYGWVCGQYGPGGVEDGLLLIFDGSWREYKIYQNVFIISRLDIYQNNFGWCVGSKTTSPPYGSFFGFFDGNSWVEVNSPTNNSTVGIKIIDKENAWIVGYYGTVLKYKPNTNIEPGSLGQIKAIYR
jgi:hypothetical protein